jgi:hypothetical protein
MRKKISTHFAKQKIEYKKNSLHAKNFKVPNYIIVISKQKDKKDPSNFHKRRLQVCKKIVGIPKDNENP